MNTVVNTHTIYLDDYESKPKHQFLKKSWLLNTVFYFNLNNDLILADPPFTMMIQILFKISLKYKTGSKSTSPQKQTNLINEKLLCGRGKNTQDEYTNSCFQKFTFIAWTLTYVSTFFQCVFSCCPILSLFSGSRRQRGFRAEHFNIFQKFTYLGTKFKLLYILLYVLYKR